MDISLVLFTRDKKDLLYNKLKYYNSLGVNILIADSSRVVCDETGISKLCEKAQYYHYDHDCPLLVKIRQTIEHVATKYFMLAPDDDYFCEEGIKACVKWLDQNPSYSAAQGRWIGFCDEIRERYVEVYRMPDQNREEGTAVDRFWRIWSTPSQWFYCVARTGPVQECFKRMGEHNEADKYTELIVTSIIAISGKLKILSVPFGVGKIHDQSPHKSAVQLREESLSGVDNGWEYMENDLAKLIADFDGAEYSFVKKKVSEAFYLYCYPQEGKSSIIPWIKGYLNKIPMISNQIIYSYFKKRDFKYSLKPPFNKENLIKIEKYIWIRE